VTTATLEVGGVTAALIAPNVALVIAAAASAIAMRLQGFRLWIFMTVAPC